MATPVDTYQAAAHGITVVILFSVSAVAVIGTLWNMRHRFGRPAFWQLFLVIVIVFVEISGIAYFIKFCNAASPRALCQDNTNWDNGIDWDDAYAAAAFESMLDEKSALNSLMLGVHLRCVCVLGLLYERCSLLRTEPREGPGYTDSNDVKWYACT